jgi:DNA ligase-1
MLLRDVSGLSERLSTIRSILEKIDTIAGFFISLPPQEGKIAFALLSGIPLFGKSGIGESILREVSTTPLLKNSSISLKELGEILLQLSKIKGSGSKKLRLNILRNLFEKLDKKDREFLSLYLLSEVHQGASSKLLFKGLLKAFEIPLSEESGLLRKGDILDVVDKIFNQGKGILRDLSFSIFTPLPCMLAEIIDHPSEILKRGKEVLLEYKMDGARIQIHRDRDKVRVFTRQLKDVTNRVDEIVSFALSLYPSSFILDGEAIVIDEKGSPLPFQYFMRRFGKKRPENTKFLLTPFIFDILYLEDEFLFDKPLRERLSILKGFLPQRFHMPYKIVNNEKDAEEFYKEAVSKGHEGLMVKDLEAPYSVGKRGKQWLKWKKSETIDLVITAAEWGHGRRKRWLSNLHLACLDERREDFLELGKTFKGLSDNELEEITRILLPNTIEDLGWMVRVRPVLVCEIEYNEIVESPFYSSGFALRFARVKRLRPDKSYTEIADIEEIRKRFLIERQKKGIPSIFSP